MGERRADCGPGGGEVTLRLLDTKSLNQEGPIVTCECGWMGPIATYPHCDRCSAERNINGRGIHHFPGYKHKGQCAVRDCSNRALKYQGKASMFCKAHSVER